MPWWPLLGAVGSVLLVVALLFLALRGRVGVSQATATALVAAVPPTASHTPAPSQTPTAAATQTPSRTPTPSRTLTPTATPALQPPNAVLDDTWERPADGMVLVYVPEGSFLMGSAADVADADSNEFPQHEVSLDAFWIDQTEVSNAQYAVCVADGDCEVFDDYGPDFTGDTQPVVGVSWNDAADYCAWAGGQLPTEAQWEYAARGPESLKYPWGDGAPDETLLNYNLNVGRTTDVGSYPAGASWVGALDMAGNVWEWVADWYDADYYDSSPAANPAGPASGSAKVLRGGSWYGHTRLVRGVHRSYYSASYRSGSIGFRCLVPQVN